MTVALEFWFDPSCPFTWRTSRWARELEQAGLAEVEWKVMSLGILNEGHEVPEGATAYAVDSYVQRGERFRAELRRIS